MAFIRKIKGSLVRQDSSDYIGEETYLFYDIEDGCLRMYDGTPGGMPACGTNTFTVIVPATSTVTIDSVPVAIHAGIKWIYTLVDTTTNETLSAEVMANHKSAASIRYSVYGIVGDLVQHGVDVVLEGSPTAMALKITNNSVNAYTINAVRIQMVS